MPVTCGYCNRTFKDAKAVKNHISNAPKCRLIWKHQMEKRSVKAASKDGTSTSEPQAADPPPAKEPEEGADDPTVEVHGDDDGRDSSKGFALLTHPEVEDEYFRDLKGAHFVEAFMEKLIVAPIQKEKTVFERHREGEKGDDWNPFLDEEEWELGRWLVQNVAQSKMNEFLKLPITRNQTQPSYHNSYSLLQKIDELPHGPEWICELVDVMGNILGEDKKPIVETVELWKRDPVECIRELIGNPVFQGMISYVPERVFADKEGQTRVYDEMWTGDWWWEVQGKLVDSAVVAPIILASDKTNLSQFRGDKAAWLVYLSIGNISKETRRQSSSRANVLLGYIPVTKLNNFTEKSRSLAGYCLFHHCMGLMLQSLIQAGWEGVEMTCADGWVCCIYPILAAYVADYLEQCLVACCNENHCPRCICKPNEKGNAVCSTLQDVAMTLQVLANHKNHIDDERFEAEGLQAVHKPFWAELPHCNIFVCFTPDLLHQLHKGLFKDHLVKWCQSIMGDKEVDARFKAMNNYPGLRDFKKGISLVKQWTGTEQKEMEMVFIGVVAGAVPSRVLAVARSLLDFIYYAQFRSHTTDTLAALQLALDTFHANKDVLIEQGVWKNFSFPKMASLVHYVQAIQSKGSADGFNTELPERLHIDFAKEAYRASNKRDYTEQMTRWLQRQEAIEMQTSYIEWKRGRRRFVQVDEDSDDNEDVVKDLQDAVEKATNVEGPPRSYSVARACPFLNVTVTRLKEDYGTANFLPALSNFLHDNLPQCSLQPNRMDHFNLYKQVVIYIASNPHTTEGIYLERIQTTTARPAGGRQAAVPAHFDTGVIIQDPEKF
ncbi:hypothetical protein JAAARDRAFT_191454 [Jaapia argillacea MUCL 33604]|uniref:C2H2-type domain-containing protein n=1 Tax=Jaapia argillacea MUCL 33604 TaxID=933084 RepID=A0A067QBQ2_9AGAM|nr:hypothetical protein JAAARDRAFT_191454 [Jaapia argillacea MUCL 33604]